MTRAPALAVLLVAGCGGGTTRHWINYACELSIAPRRDAIAFHDGDAHKLVLRRDDGDHDLAYPSCAGDGKHVAGVIALADGWRALIWGYEVSGGNGFEHGEIRSDYTCIVDFRDGSSKQLDPRTFSWDLRHFRPAVGATTGWIYNHEVGSEVVVVDLETEKAEKLAVGSDTIVEVDATARLLVEDEQGGFTIWDYDTGAWPPASRGPKHVGVKGRVDTLAVSADGRWASYTGGMLGDVYDLGLVDLETGTVAFEQIQRSGNIEVGDVVSAGDDAWLLVAQTPDPMPRDREYQAMWLDRRGGLVGVAVNLGRLSSPPTMTWMPSRSRVAAEGGCAMDLLDLPPPAKGK